MPKPVVWTIAGSDSGGGAGIQADLKTFQSFNIYGCTAITALTAQNTMGVSQIALTSPEMLKAQIEALANDLPPAAIKLGMLGDAESITYLAKRLPQLNSFLLCDPVMVSTSGSKLVSDETVTAMRQLLPHVDLLTPNLEEAKVLLGCKIEDVEEAAHTLLSNTGAKAVLLKGGHSLGEYKQDYYADKHQQFWLTSPTINTRHTHGTGCTLSAAIISLISQGFEIAEALVVSKAYVNQGLRLTPELGRGHGPLCHDVWPETESDVPWLTSNATDGINYSAFPDCNNTPLGFYPIVPRAEWLERLLPLGVTTIQLRIKDLSEEAVEDEIMTAIATARKYKARLFINDYWQLALKHGAYGVHLGQEDIETADINALAKAGIRLGLSTHSYAEVARALAIHPSYIAIGPVFPTTTKEMRFAPQGLEALARWRRTLSSYPLVAIGGMFRYNAPEVLAAGVDSIAVVRDVVNNNNVNASVNEWLDLFTQHVIPTGKTITTDETMVA